MTLLVYAVVFFVCLVTYRNFKAAVCVVTPLVLTSVLCEALMAKMGIGIKVATLPVIAVGVGIGVDYGIYIYNKLVYYREEMGHKLTSAYYRTPEHNWKSGLFYRYYPVHRRRHMGLFTHQIPGGYGIFVNLHVPV